jgi:hypothetical protein
MFIRFNNKKSSDHVHTKLLGGFKNLLSTEGNLEKCVNDCENKDVHEH